MDRDKVLDCWEFVREHEKWTAVQKIDVAGSPLIRSTADSEAVSLATETAQTEIAPGGGVMFDLDPGPGESTFSCLAGSALITPANGNLGPVQLNGGEQMAVGADEVSAVTALPRLYLPAVVAAD